MSRSQTDRILDRLNAGSLCAMEPLRWEPPITRVAARICDLRDLDHKIITQQICPFHREPQYHACYELVSQEQRSLFA